MPLTDLLWLITQTSYYYTACHVFFIHHSILSNLDKKFKYLATYLYQQSVHFQTAKKNSSPSKLKLYALSLACCLECGKWKKLLSNTMDMYINKVFYFKMYPVLYTSAENHYFSQLFTSRIFKCQLCVIIPNVGTYF